MRKIFFDKIAQMKENDDMEEPANISIELLGQWMQENSVTRNDLAKALGIQRSAVDNWFSNKRQSIPRHFIPLILHIMAVEPSSPIELKSQLVVPLNSRVLNMAVREAVLANMKVEDWIARAIEEAASGENQ